MKKKVQLPKFKNDREAADVWATHDSAAYIAALNPARLELDPALRRRIKKRARPRSQ